ncbi:MAG TPA: complex I subunit 5 family protein [Anaerolineaceae bacterium]
MEPRTALILLITLPLAATPFIYLVGRISLRWGSGNALPARWLAALTFAAAWVPLFFAWKHYQSQGNIEIVSGSISLRLDGISLLLAGVVLILATLVTIFSSRYMSGEVSEEKYYALLTAMSGTMIGLGCANDLFNLWIWFEAMAISSVFLVAFYRREPGALEAGVKYLVQSAVGSALVVLGIALVIAETGTTNLDSIRSQVVTSTPLVLAAGALFLVGFGVKAALVPMHTWLPDAHSQAPSGISAMLSGVVIEAGMIALFRALGCLDSAATLWGALLLVFGAVNMLVGNLMALRQEQVKRMLAYSSISHTGYMLLGFGAALAFNLPESAAGASFHLLTHAMMKGLAFLSVGALLYALRLSKGDHNPLLVSDLDGAAVKYPFVALTLSIALLSLGGLPPLAGFMSKWQIFVGSFASNDPIIIGLVIFAALNSVLSLGYYAPLINRLYRNQAGERISSGSPINIGMILPLLLLAASLVVLGFIPTLIDNESLAAAKSLLAAFGK